MPIHRPGPVEAVKAPIAAQTSPSGLGLRDDGRSSVSFKRGQISTGATRTPWPTSQPAWEVHSL